MRGWGGVILRIEISILKINQVRLRAYKWPKVSYVSFHSFLLSSLRPSLFLFVCFVLMFLSFIILFYVYEYFTYMHIYAPHPRLVP